MRQIGSGPTRSLLPGAGLSVYADKATIGPIVHTYSSPFTLTETAASYGSLDPIAIPPSAADIASGYIINTSCSEFTLPSAALIATALGFSPHLTPHMYFDVIIDNSQFMQTLTIRPDTSITMMGPVIPLGTIQTLRLYFVFAASTVTALAMTVPIDVFAETVNNPSFTLFIGNTSRAVQLYGQIELSSSSVVSPSSDPTVLTSSPTTYPPSLIIGSPQIITDVSYCISPPDYSGSTLFVTRGGSVGQNVADEHRTIWLPAVITKIGYRIRIVLSSQTDATSTKTVVVKLTSSTITETGTYSVPTPISGAANFLGSIASADNSGGTGASTATGNTITFCGATLSGQTTVDGAVAGDFVQLECDGRKIMVSGCMRKNTTVTLT
jgi:hypothetical protein